MSPSLMLTISPGTNDTASSSFYIPLRKTFAIGANQAIRAAAAFPALFPSIKLIVEFKQQFVTIYNIFHNLLILIYLQHVILTD